MFVIPVVFVVLIESSVGLGIRVITTCSTFSFVILLAFVILFVLVVRLESVVDLVLAVHKRSLFHIKAIYDFCALSACLFS